MHRARIGQEAIEVDEALKYLKATGFSAAKASEVIKNYMVCSLYLPNVYIRAAGSAYITIMCYSS